MLAAFELQQTVILAGKQLLLHPHRVFRKHPRLKLINTIQTKVQHHAIVGLWCTGDGANATSRLTAGLKKALPGG
ncbi:MAG: hypothetical protein P8Z31_06490 [Gammaproteobacteria bacterium]|jgi:hypothetical protein